MRHYTPLAVGLFLFAVLTITPPALAQNTTDNSTVVHAGYLLAVPGETELRNQTIVIEDGI